MRETPAIEKTPPHPEVTRLGGRAVSGEVIFLVGNVPDGRDVMKKESYLFWNDVWRE